MNKASDIKKVKRLKNTELCAIILIFTYKFYKKN